MTSRPAITYRPTAPNTPASAWPARAAVSSTPTHMLLASIATETARGSAKPQNVRQSSRSGRSADALPEAERAGPGAGRDHRADRDRQRASRRSRATRPPPASAAMTSSGRPIGTSRYCTATYAPMGRRRADGGHQHGQRDRRPAPRRTRAGSARGPSAPAWSRNTGANVSASQDADDRDERADQQRGYEGDRQQAGGVTGRPAAAPGQRPDHAGVGAQAADRAHDGDDADRGEHARRSRPGRSRGR